MKILDWGTPLIGHYPEWKRIKDPYKIWIREIILQQTRIEQGIAYYTKIITKYPDVPSLAAADEDELMALWQGLGYYSRCRNLHISAQEINRLGYFPDTYEEILKLKGVGPYTAAAVASFAFELPYAVIDGNVIRVLSRYFGLNFLPLRAEDKKLYEEFAKKCLDEKNPAVYNQIIMDFGAGLCKSQKPDCGVCPLNNTCFAFLKGKVSMLPPVKKKAELKKRYFHYFVAQKNQALFIRKRKEKDIWKGLFELPYIESRTKPSILKGEKAIFNMKQVLSHQEIYSYFYNVESLRDKQCLGDGQWVIYPELKSYAFPKSILTFFRHSMYL